MRFGALIVAVLAIAWLVVIWTAPFMSTPLAGVVYGFGSLICHQIPERSFHLAALQLPVCARCTGIYAGGASGAVVWMASGRRPPDSIVQSRERLLLIGVVAALPTALTINSEWLGLWSPPNDVRALAGVPIGAVLVLIVLSALDRVRGLYPGASPFKIPRVP
jgi:uncharacterized membrane protein